MNSFLDEGKGVYFGLFSFFCACLFFFFLHFCRV